MEPAVSLPRLPRHSHPLLPHPPQPRSAAHTLVSCQTLLVPEQESSAHGQDEGCCVEWVCLESQLDGVEGGVEGEYRQSWESTGQVVGSCQHYSTDLLTLPARHFHHPLLHRHHLLQMIQHRNPQVLRISNQIDPRKQGTENVLFCL